MLTGAGNLVLYPPSSGNAKCNNPPAVAPRGMRASVTHYTIGPHAGQRGLPAGAAGGAAW